MYPKFTYCSIMVFVARKLRNHFTYITIKLKLVISHNDVILQCKVTKISEIRLIIRRPPYPAGFGERSR